MMLGRSQLHSPDFHMARWILPSSQEETLSPIDGPPLCAGEQAGRVQSVVSDDISYILQNLFAMLSRMLASPHVDKVTVLRHEETLKRSFVPACMLTG